MPAPIIDKSLITKVEEASRYSTRLIVEDLVENLKEINCSVLGDCDDYTTSVCEEPIKSGKILSYEDKYMGGSKGESGMQASEKRIPADLSDEQTQRVRFLAGETFRVLSCHGVARVDVMIDDNTGAIYVNEINAIPGSFSFYLWEATGVPFDELMDKLVSLALKRKREQANKTVSYSQNIFALGGGSKGGDQRRKTQEINSYTTNMDVHTPQQPDTSCIYAVMQAVERDEIRIRRPDQSERRISFMGGDIATGGYLPLLQPGNNLYLLDSIDRRNGLTPTLHRG